MLMEQDKENPLLIKLNYFLINKRVYKMEQD